LHGGLLAHIELTCQPTAMPLPQPKARSIRTGWDALKRAVGLLLFAPPIAITMAVLGAFGPFREAPFHEAPLALIYMGTLMGLPIASVIADATYWTRKLRAWKKGVGRRKGDLDFGLPDSTSARDITVRSSLTASNVWITNTAASSGALDTGDDRFDAGLRTTGNERDVRALLTQRARQLLLQLATTHGVSIQAGEIVMPLGTTSRSNRRRTIDRQLDQLSQLAEALYGRTRTQQLLETALSETELAPVRGRALAALRLKKSDSAAAQQAQARLLASTDPEVWLHAGIALGPAGGQLLERLLADQAFDSQHRSDAVEPLARTLSREAAVIRLARLLEDRSGLVRSAALRALAARKIAPPLEVIEGAIGPGSPELLEAASALISSVATRGGSRLLIDVVERFWDEGWARPGPLVGCLDAVGDSGGTADIEPLLAIVDRANGVDPGLGSGAIRIAAERSIATLQARLGMAQAGGLSLAAPTGDQGGLSLADQGGQLELIGAEEVGIDEGAG
jgi:hypothetical protein